MDQAAKDVVALDPLRGERDDSRAVGGSAKVQGPVRPSGVVVVGVLGEYLSQVLLVVVGKPVGALGSHGADEPFGMGVHPRPLRRALENLDAVGGEDGRTGSEWLHTV
ncbi:hypothetical protein [Streptomyces sp. NPDC002758]